MANQPHPSKQAVTYRLPRTLVDEAKRTAARRGEDVTALVSRAITREIKEHRVITVDFRDPETALRFARWDVFHANGFRPEADAAVVTMSAAALEFLAGQVNDGQITDEDDGFYDGTHIWVGGTDYLVEMAGRDELLTEKVTEPYQSRPGQVENRTFWIAYPRHVADYGSVDDRISRALGVGDTRREALLKAHQG